MRWSYYFILMFIASAASGCSLCCSPFDNEYATYGTRTPRLDQQNGRVGSPFSDPELMGTVTTTSAEIYNGAGEVHSEVLDSHPETMEETELHFQPLE